MYWSHLSSATLAMTLTVQLAVNAAAPVKLSTTASAIHAVEPTKNQLGNTFTFPWCTMVLTYKMTLVKS